MSKLPLALLFATSCRAATWPPATCNTTWDDGSSHCFISKCNAARGPTECKSSWCQCKQDYCIADSICQWAGPGVVRGPWDVHHTSFTNKEMDVTDHTIEVYFPMANEQTAAAQLPLSFPLIGWAHGLGDGDSNVNDEYATMIHALVSFGFVVAAPASCNIGCLDSPWGSLPDDPPNFKYFYKQLLKTLTWVRNQSDAGVADFSNIDFSHGVGVAGHSMGGQAALLASQFAGQFNISAAVLQHAYTHTFPSLPDVPMLVLTGSADNVAVPSMASRIFDESANQSKIRALVNRKGQGHTEPSTWDLSEFNPAAAQFTAAWFKLFLQLTPRAFGIDFEDMIFGSGNSSLCGGGDGAMANCTLLHPTKSRTSISRLVVKDEPSKDESETGTVEYV